MLKCAVEVLGNRFLHLTSLFLPIKAAKSGVGREEDSLNRRILQIFRLCSALQPKSFLPMSFFIQLCCWTACLWATQCAPSASPLPNATAAPVAPAPVAPLAVDVAYLTGKFDPTKHPDFVKIPATHTTKPDAWLRREAWEAFARMAAEAKKEGITLTIVSATRTFSQQKNIWEGKWQRFAAEAPAPAARARKIMLYSSMPGTSRHHWGTDIDLNDLNNASFEGNGRYHKMYTWLVTHAAAYGFGQPYTPKGADRPHGYEEEKWHWSYLPLSKSFLKAYNQHLTDPDIKGFVGAETASEIEVVKHYVNGINPHCKP